MSLIHPSIIHPMASTISTDGDRKRAEGLVVVVDFIAPAPPAPPLSSGGACLALDCRPHARLLSS